MSVIVVRLLRCLHLHLRVWIVVTVKKDAHSALVAPLFNIFTFFLVNEFSNFILRLAFSTEFRVPVRHFINVTKRQHDNQMKHTYVFLKGFGILKPAGSS